MVSNFSKSSQAGKEMLKHWACMYTFVSSHSLTNYSLSTWGAVFFLSYFFVLALQVPMGACMGKNGA